MLSAVAMFLVVGTTHLHLVGVHKDMNVCKEVIKAVKMDELRKPVEPLIGESLICTTITYAPPEQTVEVPTDNVPSKDVEHKEEVPPCVSRKVLGTEAACGKDA